MASLYQPTLRAPKPQGPAGEITLAVSRIEETEAGRAEHAAELSILADRITQRVTYTEHNALGNTVAEHETRITQTEDEIQSQVSRTEFDDLGGRVTQAESDITQQATLIEQRVKETDFNALGDRVSETETRITQAENNITLKVSQSDFDALGNTVSQHETQIEQNKDQVTISAIEEAFGKEIDSAIFDLDANGISQRVTSAEQEIGTLQTSHDALSNRLDTTETDVSDLETALNAATGGSDQSIDDLYTLYSTVSSQTTQNESRWQAEADRIDAMVGPNDEALDEWDPSSSEHDSFMQAFETQVKTEATEASITAAKSAAIGLGAEQAGPGQRPGRRDPHRHGGGASHRRGPRAR